MIDAGSRNKNKTDGGGRVRAGGRGVGSKAGVRAVGRSIGRSVGRSVSGPFRTSGDTGPGGDAVTGGGTRGTSEENDEPSGALCVWEGGWGVVEGLTKRGEGGEGKLENLSPLRDGR